MRIAIASDWFAPRAGGIEMQLGHLAAGLARRGHQVEVITSTPDARDGPGYRVLRPSVRNLPFVHLSLSPALPGALRDLIAAGHYDVLHAHVSVMSPVGYVAAMAARAAGLPTVVTFHSVLHAKRVLLKVAAMLGRLRESPIVWTAVSALVSRQAGHALDAPVLVLPNGIAVGQWASRTTAPAPPVTFVSATRLHRKKRPRQLLLAFSRAATRAGVPSRLLIAGDGPERARVERDILALGLAGGAVTAQCVGWLPADRLGALYAEAHAFAMASLNESFGIAALEARASGLPVIAMRRAGTSEFITHGQDGFLCDSDDDLARAMESVMRDPTRWAAPPASETLARHDWEAVLNAHDSVYALARSRTSTARWGAGTA